MSSRRRTATPSGATPCRLGLQSLVGFGIVSPGKFRTRFGAASLVLAALSLTSRSASATTLTIANPSFEAPAFSDGGFAGLVSPAGQGTYGWTTGDSAGIYNPPALDYSIAGGGGTPDGAHGAQIGFVAGFGDYVIRQQLAGPDGVVGNDNDPVLEPYTIYMLTVAVGQRAVGNTYNATNGGYDIQLRAGLEISDVSVVTRETDAVALQPGTFLERTVTWDSALVNPERLGLPLTILLRKTIVSATADTDFDNVRLEAVYVPPTADFNLAGGVNGADLAIWKTGYGHTECDARTGRHGPQSNRQRRRLSRLAAAVGGSRRRPQQRPLCRGRLPRV